MVAGAVATYCSAYCDWDAFGVARYDAAGTLDPAFGTGGHVTITFARGAAEGYGVAIEPDGKIVVAGYAGSGTDGAFALARLLPDGTPDAGFGTNGQVITDIDPDFRDAAFALLRQPDGKIVAGGYTPYSGWALARYLPNGSLDSTFGNQGIVETLIGDNTAYLFSLALQADGKILAGGQASPSCTDTCPPGPFALARYLPDGTLDSTFGSGGIVQTIMSPAGDSRVYGLAVQPDGRILAGGPAGLNCWDPGCSPPDFALARYTAAGTLDASFGSGGTVLTDFGASDDEANALALQADGKIILAGFVSAPPDYYAHLALARYGPDGSLDPGFGYGGKQVVTSPYAGAEANALQIDSAGRLVAAGMGWGISGQDYLLARFLTTGPPPPTPTAGPSPTATPTPPPSTPAPSATATAPPIRPAPSATPPHARRPPRPPRPRRPPRRPAPAGGLGNALPAA